MHWRCSLRIISNGDSANTEHEPLQLSYCRRNGSHRSILLGANTSPLNEKSPWGCLFLPMCLANPNSGIKASRQTMYSLPLLSALMLQIRQNDWSSKAFQNRLSSNYTGPQCEYGMPVYLPNLVADINHLERRRLATVVSGYKPWVRSAWQRGNTGSGTKSGVFASGVK